MVRIKRGVSAHLRHKKILKKTKGYRGARSRSYRVAYQSVIKSNQYSYRDRRQRKRKFRQIWIIRINAAVRKYNITYNKFIFCLKNSSVKINRKILANVILFDKFVFDNLIKSIIPKD
ncbi:MAG: 50S ribosomal subunit protein L20 [Candidatus Westeberhardia cardiocondylae]|nr:50S ribosomal subunit protein L20 [Candidatus Westeberhardia cardiocondylae]